MTWSTVVGHASARRESAALCSGRDPSMNLYDFWILMIFLSLRYDTKGNEVRTGPFYITSRQDFRTQLSL